MRRDAIRFNSFRIENILIEKFENNIDCFTMIYQLS